ncbi:MAG: protein kinase [Deltaproteobacteria bacterium]|nr:protein kinase [Deltaproteobacteria bacterium]
MKNKKDQNKLSLEDSLNSIVRVPLTTSPILKVGEKEIMESDPAPTSLEEELFNKIIGAQNKTKYKIEGQIAKGSMGEVFHVYDEDFQRYLVLKIILPQHKKVQTVINSFIEEARLTAQIEHPNIIPVHDIGFIPGYGIYFTMKHLKGETLKDILTKIKDKDTTYTQKYDGYELLRIVRKVCDAVSYAHSKNIIHRDIKPQNIMVGDFGEVLLMDWGMAKKRPETEHVVYLEETEEYKNKKAGSIEGSPGYMSPEQAYGATAAIDCSSDLYLVGATLYHIYTMMPPYTGKTLKTVLERARGNVHTPPENAAYPGHHMPTALCRVINTAMNADKKKRYATIQELIRDLDDVISGKTFYETRFFKAGTHLVKEGETGNEAYIIQTGTVQVYKSDKNKKIVLSELKSGDAVCEMALITSDLRSASVLALTDTEVLVVSKEHFSRNLQNLPPWMEKIVVTLANRLEVSNKRLMKTRDV